MNPFITFRDTVSNGDLQYYILQRAWPHYIGVITLVPVERALVNVPVAGYHLYVTFDGVLQGNYVPGHKDVYEEIQSIFTEMARWYLENRITPQENKYKKWKLHA